MMRDAALTCENGGQDGTLVAKDRHDDAAAPASPASADLSATVVCADSGARLHPADAALARSAAFDPARARELALLAEDAACRLAALALLDDWDGEAGDAIPQETWDALYAEKLIASQGDQTGESWPVLTREGRDVLLAALREEARRGR